MINRISQINVKAKHVLSWEIIDIFNFSPIKWINIFYCPNGYWKSTLFKYLKEILSFDTNDILDDVPHIEVEWYFLYSIFITLNIWKEQFNLEYKYKEDKKQLVRLYDPQELIKKIYKQNPNLKENDKKNFMDKRTSPASLNRYSFINSDRIMSSDGFWSWIIDSHKDWKIKWVLFDYILWMTIEKTEIKNSEILNASYYFCKNEYLINKHKEELKKVDIWKKDFWLFADEQREKITELRWYENDFQELNIATIDLNHAINKLTSMLNEIRWKKEFEDFEKIINLELINLTNIKDEYISMLDENRNELNNKIDEYKDRIQTNQIEYVKLEKEIEKMEKENLNLEPQYKKYLEKKELNRKNFMSIYKDLLNQFWFQWCEIKLDELKLDVRWINNSSEATSKICRLLFFIALQKLKKESDLVRNLWIWFYDWVLDWVWYDKIYKIFQTTQTFNVQSFYFIPKLIDWIDPDPFKNKLIELEKKWNLKLFNTWNKDKIFSK